MPVLPARLRYAWNLARESQLAEADPAQRKLPDVPSRPPAALAAVPVADLKLRLLLVFRDLRGCRHSLFLFFLESLLPERHAQMPQQRQPFGVRTRRGRNGYVHALRFVDLVIVDFRKDQLIAHAQRVVTPPVK